MLTSESCKYPVTDHYHVDIERHFCVCGTADDLALLNYERYGWLPPDRCGASLMTHIVLSLMVLACSHGYVRREK